MTQEAVASCVGTTVKSVRSWEKSDVRPDTFNLERLADLFDVSLDYILGLSDFTRVENEYIGKSLGLSDESIERLRKLKSATEEFPAAGIPADTEKRELQMINFLLGYGRGLLEPLYQCIFGEYDCFAWDGMRTESVWLFDRRSAQTESATLLSVREMEEIFFLALQRRIYELRSAFCGRGDDG